MAGIGRDGLNIELITSRDHDRVVLIIRRDDCERREEWPNKQAAMTRCERLLVKWESDRPPAPFVEQDSSP